MPSNIRIYRNDLLGQADYGWLKTKYHFSFANYYNKERMEFGNLRVINDDIIESGKGFDTHAHKDMEIITYVRKGSITHKDSLGNSGITEAGDVQVMSAGTGILHSEYNLSGEDTLLYQIWIKPNKLSVKPRWEAMTFPKKYITNKLHLLVSGREETNETEDKDFLFIYQDAAIYGGKMKSKTIINHSIKHQAYMLVSQGKVIIAEDNILNAGDGAEIVEIDSINIHAVEDSEIIIIDTV